MKSPEMTRVLDQLSQATYGRSRSNCIAKGVCVVCGKPATEFNDTPSKREYGISGMCQDCQNDFFA